MTGKEFKYIQQTIEQEGFDYSFEGYSDFEDIKDEKFHELRKAFLKARAELSEYIGCDE